MTPAEREILRIEKQQVADFNRREVNRILEQFAPEFVGFSSTRHNRIAGRAALGKTFQQVELQIQPGDSVRRLEIVDLKVHRDFKVPSNRLASENAQTLQWRLADAAWAETELARLPVEAQATVSNPSSRARVRATATTRSLNDRVG